MGRRVHIIGAGLAGLAAGLTLTAAGRPVVLHEATDHAGGRCRSYHDHGLGRCIDNGNHLVVGANAAVFDYLAEVGALGRMRAPAVCNYPFHDLETGEQWIVRPNAGRVPWWIMDRRRRVPGAGAMAHLCILRLARAGPAETVGQLFDPTTPIFRRLLEPLVVAIANTSAAEAAAQPLWTVLARVFARGADSARGFVARDGLSDALVDPTLAALSRRGAAIRFKARLRHLATSAGRAVALGFGGEGDLALGPDDDVIVATPPAVTAALLPGVRVPLESRAILNLHFRLAAPVELPAGAPYLGLIGGRLAQWVFQRGDMLSATVSAADAVMDLPAADLARLGWGDVARALRLTADLPPYQVIKERRATFAQTPAGIAARSTVRTPWANVFLAGDWVDTGLPASIEGAILSGRRAAAASMRHREG